MVNRQYVGDSVQDARLEPQDSNTEGQSPGAEPTGKSEGRSGT